MQNRRLTQKLPIPQPRRSILKSWIRDLVISISISIFCIMFLYQPVKVEGTSMLPELQDQERIFINKFVYRWEAISRSDIVVFHYPRDPEKSYIKRVVALPGDKLKIVEGQLYVNDEPVKESYVPQEYFDYRSYAQTTIPDDSYFVLGDHRSLSNDSREFGFVKRDLIYGKAVFVYWPTNRLGLLH